MYASQYVNVNSHKNMSTVINIRTKGKQIGAQTKRTSCSGHNSRNELLEYLIRFREGFRHDSLALKIVWRTVLYGEKKRRCVQRPGREAKKREKEEKVDFLTKKTAA